MGIDHFGGAARYRQLADLLRKQIESGEIEPGSWLPSLRVLCETYDVARATAQKAVNVLRDEGVVRGVVGIGVYVVPPAERPKRKR